MPSGYNIYLNIGDKFGDLTVVSPTESYKFTSPTTGKQSSRKRWICQCKCGKTYIATGTLLRRGKIQRCKTCAYKMRPQSLERYTPIERLYNLSIISRAKKKNLPIDLSISEFQELVQQDCYYCGAHPMLKQYVIYVGNQPIYANGIDRIDPNIGYIKSNCIPCCKHCNIAKSDLNKEEFFALVANIYHKHIDL
mgnify:CR=1 FL=1